MLTLYYSEKSCSYAPHILLYETGTDFVAKRIDFDTSEQNSPHYLSVNPKGRVPALMTPDGVLTENPAILLYIAQIFPEKQLAPKEPRHSPLICILRQLCMLAMLINIVDQDGRTIKPLMLVCQTR